MKLFRTSLLAALLLASTQISHAQAPAPGAPGTTGTATDAGAISNTTTTTTTTTAPATTTGIPADVTFETAPLEGEATDATLANTGGSPLLMSLAGLSLAAIAFGLRRKVSA